MSTLQGLAESATVGTLIECQMLAKRRQAEDPEEMRDLVRLAEIQRAQAALLRESYEITQRRIERDLRENHDHNQLVDLPYRAACSEHGIASERRIA